LWICARFVLADTDEVFEPVVTSLTYISISLAVLALLHGATPVIVAFIRGRVKGMAIFAFIATVNSSLLTIRAILQFASRVHYRADIVFEDEVVLAEVTPGRIIFVASVTVGILARRIKTLVVVEPEARAAFVALEAIRVTP